jgi:alanine racemase
VTDSAAHDGLRWAWAEVDFDSVAHNISVLRRTVAPSAIWVVVKANGYGHGAVGAAQAALSAGAEGLCVALVQEGVELRRAGLDAPILILTQQPAAQFADIIEYRLTPTLYQVGQVAAFAAAARATGRSGFPVHVKVDTGMHRVGAAAAEAIDVVAAVKAAAPTLRLAGVFTHLACADEPGRPETDIQLDRFDEAIAGLAARPPLVHAANSAAALAFARARHDLVRVGIAAYGLEPGPGVADLCGELRPAMALKARVGFAKVVSPGAAVSYGGRWTAVRPTVVASIPIGYADGMPRRLGSVGGEVLIGGRRRPIVGSVTMDQIMADCGDPSDPDNPPVAIGDEVVLIGGQGHERIRADDWATKLGTIPYEIVCGISNRVPRIVRWTQE